MASPVELVIVDDHPLFVHGLELLLGPASDGRLSVTGVTADPASAAALVRRCRPQIVLVDLVMPQPGGIRAIAAIRRAEPGVRVVALSGTADVELIAQALRAGASGFLPKTARPDELVAPLLAMTEGWSVLPTSVLADLAGEPRPPVRGTFRLTGEQRLLWRLVASGATTAEIALQLHVSERTVKRLVSRLLRLLGVTTRAEAAAMAGRAGILDER
ncbi:DNA-binding response regulator [Virgisporangium aliadipatigenens]|uniref:DNA-binding response regulator n=1 Tax=Virgisporangium aliadipatigenens TaxID=741659 RepID=A0A8J3YIP4_9ACTN|nr:response regulator transcription factor [Virgisporangium aliadipatigenens]GIJ45137.1 DNA-binding response regulator [Virgisporangium aliadipatigenens]